MDFNSWNIVWSLCFGLLATLIVVGNVLTICVFLKLRLRKRAHFLLIGLAVADLLVGLLSALLLIACEVTSYEVRQAAFLFRYADIFTGITSIYTLAVISLERMYAIGWPVRHRTLNLRVYVSAIVIPWIVAVVVTSLDVLRSFNFVSRKNFMNPIILFQSIPLLVMCAAYCVIWRKQKSPTICNQKRMAREARLAKTLFMITGASLLTWLPFQIMNLLLSLNVIGYFPNYNATLYIVKFLHFSNSLVNVIIYPFRISEFKNVLLQMFHCCVTPFQRENEVAPINQVRLGHLRPCQELQVSND